MGESTAIPDDDRRFVGITVSIAAFIGGLCCFTSVGVVLLGLGSVSYAASLADLLYYEYAWAFRLAGLASFSRHWPSTCTRAGSAAWMRPADSASGYSLWRS